MVSKRYPIEIPWHEQSEQPYVIPDRAMKRLLQQASLGDHVKGLMTSIWYAPLILSRFLAMRSGSVPAHWVKPSPLAREFMGIAVGLMSCPWQQLSNEVQELGVKHVLLRIPVWDLENVEHYRKFIDSLPDCEVVVCIMQDRHHCIDHQRWMHALTCVVDELWPRVTHYQIGQGSNRSKWSFFSMGEYLRMAEVSSALRENYAGIELMGPGVLDFELIPSVRGLIHESDIKWDVVTSGLYVDRRGSPRNKQFGIFDLKAKIQALAAVMSCASKCKRRLWISEVNWPLQGQGEYSPTSEHECVSESDYDQFMQHYLIDAWRSQLVERVYWWQLVAKGYGLMDINDDGSLRQRPAYKSFKAMLEAQMTDF